MLCLSVPCILVNAIRIIILVISLGGFLEVFFVIQKSPNFK